MIRHVYRIECPHDPRAYIGVSANPKSRFSQHKKHGYGALWEAMRDFGLDAFTLSIISSHESRLDAYAAERAEAMRLLQAGQPLYNKTFKATAPAVCKDAPISIRPRQGTALEAVWEAESRSNRAMGEIIHGWAETFAIMAKASDKREEENDA